MHAVCGYPVKSTLIKAVKADNFTGWPLLNEKNTQKYYPETNETDKGSARAKFDQLRRQIDGRPQAFCGHNILAIPAKVEQTNATTGFICQGWKGVNNSIMIQLQQSATKRCMQQLALSVRDMRLKEAVTKIHTTQQLGPTQTA
eukprot:scaffold12009_cov61-Cyclotella_meneghiniana.AAC.3